MRLGEKIAIGLLIAFSGLSANDSLFLKNIFNESVCDQVLTSNIFITCYDYKMKGAKFVAYTINGDTVNKNNIKERPRFYDDLRIPKQYRSTYSDYTQNYFKADRGHLAEHESFNDTQSNIKQLYVMSNIIPQHFSINRGSTAWLGAERFGRFLATNMGRINVLNGVEYSDSPKRIGHNQIAIPRAFWKMYYSDDMKYKRCFYFVNEPLDESLALKDFEVECSSLIKIK